MGLRPVVRALRRAPSPSPALAPSLQLASSPHRLEEQNSYLQTPSKRGRPVETSQLGRGLDAEVRSHKASARLATGILARFLSTLVLLGAAPCHSLQAEHSPRKQELLFLHAFEQVPNVPEAVSIPTPGTIQAFRLLLGLTVTLPLAKTGSRAAISRRRRC
jgi:hypothetical protein